MHETNETADTTNPTSSTPPNLGKRRFKHLAPALSALTAATVLAGLGVGFAAEADPGDAHAGTRKTAEVAGLDRVAPALAAYRDNVVVGDLWSREQLSPRDRSLVTVAQMVASGQTTELGFYLDKALDDGVEPAELSEAVTHLAFYAGWENAMAAVPALRQVFDVHRVDRSELPAVNPDLLPLDEEAEAARARQVEADFSQVAPGVVENTTRVLFRDLWLRPDLAPRDRSLVTVVALIATGQVQQIPYHLGRAMDNGLTRVEVGETLNQLAFYAGWPKVFSAMPVVREVFASRD